MTLIKKNNFIKSYPKLCFKIELDQNGRYWSICTKTNCNRIKDFHNEFMARRSGVGHYNKHRYHKPKRGIITKNCLICDNYMRVVHKGIKYCPKCRAESRRSTQRRWSRRRTRIKNNKEIPINPNNNSLT